MMRWLLDSRGIGEQISHYSCAQHLAPTINVRTSAYAEECLHHGRSAASSLNVASVPLTTFRPAKDAGNTSQITINVVPLRHALIVQLQSQMYLDR